MTLFCASYQKREECPMKLFAYSISVLLIAAPAHSSSDKQVFLSMKQFNQTADRAHAFCANIDLDFSEIFYECIDEKMRGIYIDSSTVGSRN